MNDLPQIVRDWLGKTVVTVDRTVTAERELWLNFCAAVGDGNPLYWDTERPIAPPAMLASWGVAHDWYPAKQGTRLRPLELHFMLKDVFDLPHGIVTQVEFEFHEPVRAGDRVSAEQVLREVGNERTTRLGPGRNWTIEVAYRRADRVLLGLQCLKFLSYRSA